MAVTALLTNVPKKVTLTTAYSAFSYRNARNLQINCSAGAVYYHPTKKDGTAVDATEQFQLPAGTYSMRLPGSGCGSAIGGTDDNSGESPPIWAGPDGDGLQFFSIAAATGTFDVWLWVSEVNFAS